MKPYIIYIISIVLCLLYIIIGILIYYFNSLKTKSPIITISPIITGDIIITSSNIPNNIRRCNYNII